MDSRPRWVEALRRFVANTPPEPKLNLPASHPMFGTVRQLNPLRIALDNDPTTWLPYTPPCLDYPTRVGQRVWVETYDGRVVVVGVARGTPDLPVGTAALWWGPAAKIPELPWMIADGAAISRTDFAEAFALWGTTYGGGNGSTTFNLPNTRGRVVVGYDSAQGEFDGVGKTGGAKTVTLSVNQMPAHTHLSERHQYFTPDGWAAGRSLLPVMDTNGAFPVINAGKSAGGDEAHPNLQPYIVGRVMVKVR